jgi:hypothetical protein
MRRPAAALAALPLLVVLAGPADAHGDRMQLDCGDRVIERTNGASWFGEDDGARYVTASLRITEDGALVHEKEYGAVPQGERTTCVGDHAFGDTLHRWTVVLVQVR